jgi:hypothetical protein
MTPYREEDYSDGFPRFEEPRATKGCMWAIGILGLLLVILSIIF